LSYGKMLEEVSRTSKARSSVLTVRTAKYEADQFGAKINAVQKEIGQLKKVRPNPSL
jgi:hypothetical protein